MVLRRSLLVLLVGLMADARPRPHLFHPGRSYHPFQSGEWRMLRVCDKSTEVCYYKVDGEGGQTKIECFMQKTSCTDLGYRWFPSQEVAKDIDEFDKMFEKAEDTGGKEGIGDNAGDMGQDRDAGDGKSNEFEVGGVIETVINGVKGVTGMGEDSEIGSGEGEGNSEVNKSDETIDEGLNGDGLVNKVIEIVTEATNIVSKKKEETEEETDDVIENVLESIDRTEHTKKAEMGNVDDNHDNHDNHKSKGIFEIFKEVVTEATNIIIDSKKEIEDLFGNQVIPSENPVTEIPPTAMEKDYSMPINESNEMEEKMDKTMPSIIIDGEMIDRTENTRKESINEIETIVNEEKEDVMVNEEGSGQDKNIFLENKELELISNIVDTLETLESSEGMEQASDDTEKENELSVIEITVGNGGDFIFPEVTGDEEIYVSAEIPNTENKETKEEPIVSNTNIIVFPEGQITENEIMNVDETINLITDSYIPENVSIEDENAPIEQDDVNVTNILAFPEDETKNDETNIELLPIDLSSLEQISEVTTNTENNININLPEEDAINNLSFPENTTNELDLDLLPVELPENVLDDYADFSSGDNDILNVDETINLIIDSEPSTSIKEDKVNDANILTLPEDKTKNDEVIIDLLPIDVSSLEEISDVTTNTEMNIITNNDPLGTNSKVEDDTNILSFLGNTTNELDLLPVELPKNMLGGEDISAGDNEIINADETINLIIDSDIPVNVSIEEPSTAIEENEVNDTTILALPEDKTKNNEVIIDLLPIDLTNNDPQDTNSQTEDALVEDNSSILSFTGNTTNQFDLDLLPVDLDEDSDFSAGEDIKIKELINLEATSVPQEMIPDYGNHNASIIKDTIAPENGNISDLVDTNKNTNITKEILMTEKDIKKEGNNAIFNNDLKGGSEVLNEVLVENPILSVATLVTDNPEKNMQDNTESPIKILTGYTNVVMANPGIVLDNTDQTGIVTTTENLPTKDVKMGSKDDTVTENFVSAIFNEDSNTSGKSIPSLEIIDEIVSEETTQENDISVVTESNTQGNTTLSEDILPLSGETGHGGNENKTVATEMLVSEETTLADTTQDEEVSNDITALTESAEAIIKELTALSKDIPENAEAITRATTKVLNLVEKLTTLSENIPENAYEISKATTEVMNLVIELHSLSNNFSNNAQEANTDFTTVNMPNFEEEIAEVIVQGSISDTTSSFENGEDLTTVEIPKLDKEVQEDLTTISEETSFDEDETEVTTHMSHDITSTTTEDMDDEDTAFTTNIIKQKEDSPAEYDESILGVNLNMYYPLKLEKYDEIVSISKTEIKSTEKTQIINTNDTENVEEYKDIIKEINDKYKEKTQGIDYTQVELIEIPEINQQKTTSDGVDSTDNMKKEKEVKKVEENEPTESILEDESATFDSLPFPPQGWLVHDHDDKTTTSGGIIEDITEKSILTDSKDSELVTEEGNSPWVINIPILVEEMENNKTVDTDTNPSVMTDSIQSISVVFPDAEAQQQKIP